MQARKHRLDMFKHGSGWVWSAYDREKMFQTFDIKMCLTRDCSVFNL
jgi:hypothetical protein